MVASSVEVYAATAEITAPDSEAAEPSDPGGFVVTLDTAALVDTTVNYTVSGTATEGTDYQALSGSVVIGQKRTAATIDVTPIDDNIDEPTEVVRITLQKGGGYTVGAMDTAKVTLVDDDPGIASVTASDASAGEPNDPGTFTVMLTNPQPSDVTINYKVGGTATGGTDYSALPGSVTVPSGTTSATFDVTPIDDSDDEATETVTVLLSAGIGYRVGSPSSATVNIADDDVGSASITATDASASEPSDPGTFEVTLDQAPPNDVTVNYTVGGTATAGSDYTALSGSVTVPAGSTGTTFGVTPIDDTEAEGSESVVVTLTSGSGYSIGGASSASVSIADDEASVSSGIDAQKLDGGDAQQGRLGDTVTLRIRVVDGAGNPVADAPVSWSMNPEAASAGGSFNSADAATDASGEAGAVVALATTPVAHQISAEATASVAGGGTVSDTEVFAIAAGLVADAAPNTPEEAIAKSLDKACPALSALPTGSRTTEQQALLDRCNELINASTSGDTTQVRAALRAVAPVEVAVQGRMAGVVAHQQLKNLTQRLEQLRRGGPGQTSAERSLVSNSLQVAVNGKPLPMEALSSLVAMPLETNAAEGEVQSLRERRLGLFVTGDLAIGDRDRTAREDGFEFDTRGVTLGADYRLRDDLVLGAALGFARTEADMDQAQGGTDVSGYSVSAFGTYYYNDRTYIDGILSYGNNDYETDRRVSYTVGGSSISETARGNTDSSQLVVSVGGGYALHRKGGLESEVYGRLDYVDGSVDAYTERDATAFSMRIEEQDLGSLRTVLGANVRRAFSADWGVWVPYGRIEWEHELDDDGQLVQGHLLADPSGTQFAFRSDQPDEDYLRAGAGVSVVLQSGVQAFVEYETVVGRENYSQQDTAVGVRYERAF